MNKSVYLTFPILEIIKTLRQKFWYDYIKPKYLTNAKLCYMDTGGVINQIKTEDFHKDFADDVKKLFDTTNYRKDDKIPLTRGMNNKVVGLIKDELGWNIMIEFVSFRQKTYSYLMDDDKSVKKTKGTKKCVIKQRTKFNSYKDCLLNNKIVLESLQRFKTEAHCVYTEEVDKISLGSNHDKRLQTFDRITTYLYGTNAFKVCESQMLSKNKWLIWQLH